MECLRIVGVYMCGVHRDCGCVHVWRYRDCGCVHKWVMGMYMCGVHRDCGCVDVWSA